MSNNLTENLNDSQDTKLDRLITAVQTIDSRIASLDSRIESLESRIESLDSRIGSLESRIESLDSRIGILDSRIESLESRIESLESRIESLDSRIESLDSRLASLETKVDQRLHDTQPIWEAVQAQLSEIRDTTEKGFRTIDRRMERQIGEFERLHAYQRDLEDRVDRIEKLQNP
jgi:peptidoglycan hydrolase CwlO-like protein